MAEPSAPSEHSIKSALEDRLQAFHVEVEDISGGCGQSFTSLIVSPQFAHLNPLKRHRLVNTALKQEIAQMHAWTARCQTPDEWERGRAKEQAKEQAPTAKEPTAEGAPVAAEAVSDEGQNSVASAGGAATQ